jgi:Predicted membrane protein
VRSLSGSLVTDSTGPLPFAIRIATPVQAAGRIETLDILRGCALMGMIFVHFFRMALPAHGLEGRIGLFVLMAVETKAWATFAFLFGIGFAILLRRAEARGTPFASFYLRRLLALGAIGAAAQVFFHAGVLLDYALWGLPLLLVRKWSTRSLLVLAVVAGSATPLYDVGRHAIEAATLGRETATVAAHQRSEEAATKLAALRTTEAEGGYGELFRARLNHMAHTYLNPQVLIPGVSFALFLLGLLAVRYGIIEQPRRNVRPIAIAMLLGLASWVSFWWLLPLLPIHFAIAGIAVPVRGGLGIVRDQWLALMYVGVLVLLLAYWPVWVRRLRPFGAAGRMALTNYVLHGAVLDYLASGYGLGLQLRPYVLALAAFGLFAAEVVLSQLWLARFRQGPLEWVWRSLSYGEPQPMLLNPSIS